MVVYAVARLTIISGQDARAGAAKGVDSVHAFTLRRASVLRGTAGRTGQRSAITNGLAVPAPTRLRVGSVPALAEVVSPIRLVIAIVATTGLLIVHVQEDLSAEDPINKSRG